jgi:dienelactone hydrolase
LRKLALLLGVLVALVAAPSASAAPPTSIFGGDVDCGTVTDAGTGGDAVPGSVGQTWCGTFNPGATGPTLTADLNDPRSTTKTFDGVPLDVNVALPSSGSAPYPVVGIYHGYGGSKSGFGSMQRWLDQGYAVYTLSQRGFGESCRTQASRDADPAGCAKGYVHLMDLRYEVRDSQLLLGELVDEGLIDPNRIAATGGSYGGGMSLEMAALKDRTMLLDGTLVPWESPEGTPMSLAVATPTVPWSELTYALAPNGNNLDYIEDAGYWGRTGVMKESYVQALSTQGFKAPIGSDPRADIDGWKARLDQGEPYDDDPFVGEMKDEINTYHSAYGVPHDESPAPLLISSGFTDDLFPVNEATRFYNRTRAEHPDSPLALFFGSFGHPRGQTQANVLGAQNALENEWVAHYLKGTGPAPASNVTTYTQTCPNGADGAGPYTAPDWASIAPGEIRLRDDGAAQAVDPDGGNPAIGAAFNPINATACTTAAGAEEPGTANYELPAAPAGGYTVMGAATVIARISLPGDTSQVAARLVDVSPDGATKTLVERGLWRPENRGLQVFQLFANGWKVEQGHVLRLELLPRDAAGPAGGFLANYGRPSNDQQEATISDVDLRVPVLESPGALGGLVTDPAPKVLPKRPGVELAPGYESVGAVTIRGDIELTGKPKVKGRKLQVKVRCDGDANYSCRKARLKLVGAPKGKHARGRNAVIARGKDIRVGAGKTEKLKLKLTKRARKLLSGRRAVRKLRTEVIIRGTSAGFTTTKRAGGRR